jgi:hypothetical protein
MGLHVVHFSKTYKFLSGQVTNASCVMVEVNSLYLNSFPGAPTPNHIAFVHLHYSQQLLDAISGAIDDLGVITPYQLNGS